MEAVRGHNEGSIFHRAADSHRVASVTMANGKRPTLTCPHKHRPSDRDCPEAKANLIELLRLRDQGAPADGHTLTLGKYLQGWLDDVRPDPADPHPRLAPATWRKHDAIVRHHITPMVGHRRLSELSVMDVRRLLDTATNARTRRLGDNERLPPLHGQTRRHIRGTLRRALADALRDGLVSRNVAALSTAPKLDRREHPTLTAEQARTLMDGTRDDPLHPLWVLAVTTGMRLAEMLALTWADVDLDKATVTVASTLHRIDGEWSLRGTKTEKSRRTVHLPPVTVAALRAIRRPAGMVFVSSRGYPLHGSNLPKELHKTTDRLGLPRVTIHDLRHSAATILYSVGVPLEAIADMLGHSTTRVTADLYRHRVEAIQVSAAERMQEAIG